MYSLESLPLPRTILWDMDGTLIDQTATIIRTYGEVIESINGNRPDPHRIRRSLGGPMASTLALFVDELQIEEASTRFRNRFPEIMFDGLIVLPGASELVEDAFEAGITQAILTNKHGETARDISEHIGFSKCIPTCIGSKDTDWNKPQPELVHHTLTKINATIEDACMIGDSPTDVETARSVEMHCYCVTTGAHSAQELKDSGADAVFDSLLDIKKAFGF